MASGKFYQVVLTISARTAGSVSVSIGSTLVDAYGGEFAANGAYTRGPKATGTGALTITPTTDFNGTVAVSIKLITPVSAWGISAQDSTGATSWQMSRSLASLNNLFIGNGGRYNTTGSYNTFYGVIAGAVNTTGSYNTY
jgi:hypothetical protein